MRLWVVEGGPDEPSGEPARVTYCGGFRVTVPPGLAAAGVRIKHQKHLWGSCCTDGVLYLNQRLIAAPKPVLEYAVVHELCHLRHRDHGLAFWSLVARALPDYAERKAWLAGWEG